MKPAVKNEIITRKRAKEINRTHPDAPRQKQTGTPKIIPPVRKRLPRKKRLQGKPLLPLVESVEQEVADEPSPILSLATSQQMPSLPLVLPVNQEVAEVTSALLSSPIIIENGEISSNAQSTAPPRPPSLSSWHYQVMSQGSDEDLGDSDEDDEVVGFANMPRIIRAIFDTHKGSNDPYVGTGDPYEGASYPYEVAVYKGASDLHAGAGDRIIGPGDSFEVVVTIDPFEDARDPHAAPEGLALPSEPDSITAAIPPPLPQPTAKSHTYGPHDFLDFDWRPFPEIPIPPEARRETFSHSHGPTTPLYDPYDLFVAIWDREFLSHIVTETNRYAQQTASKMFADNSLHPSSRICDWVDTSVDELYCYLAIVLAMGIIIRTSLVEYWNTDRNIFCTPGFRLYMTLRRFQLLNKMIHFNNSEALFTRNFDTSEARLFKIQPVLDHLNRRFSEMYEMGQNIALDESLLQWKGWLDINQIIPNKSASEGIKSYEVCESQTGYLWRCEIHASKKTAIHDENVPEPLLGITPALVLRLIDGLEYRGHTLWMESYYNSPALARKLKSLGFDCAGTLRTNQQMVPPELNNLTKADMRPGQIAGFTSGDVDLMVWRDQNRVATISTYHGNAVSTSKDGVLKPILVRDYSICIGGMDKKDQMLSSYPIERKRTTIWYKKLFRRLVNVSTLNAFIIHKQSASATKLTHHNFRNQLVLSLLSKHSTTSSSMLMNPADHCPAEFPFIPNGRGRKRRTCVVCKCRTHTYCAGCDKALCVFKCWNALHKR